MNKVFESKRIIIVAGREYNKWNMYTGTHQHLVNVLGRPLLRRTAIQFREFTTPDNLFVTIPDYAEEKYREALNGIDINIIPKNGREASEFESTRDLWNENKKGRTIMVLGDVLFSKRTVNIIANDQSESTPGYFYHFYGRPSGSKVTGYKAGEGWGYSWSTEDNAMMDYHVKIVHDTRALGKITRPPGWMVLRSWSGVPLHKHICLAPWFVNCDFDGNDYTEDFDTPINWDSHPISKMKREGS